MTSAGRKSELEAALRSACSCEQSDKLEATFQVRRAGHVRFGCSELCDEFAQLGQVIGDPAMFREGGSLGY